MLLPQPPLLFWGALSAPLAHEGGSLLSSKYLQAGVHPLALNHLPSSLHKLAVLRAASLRPSRTLYPRGVGTTDGAELGSLPYRSRNPRQPPNPVHPPSQVSPPHPTFFTRLTTNPPSMSSVFLRAAPLQKLPSPAHQPPSEPFYLSMWFCHSLLRILRWNSPIAFRRKPTAPRPFSTCSLPTQPPLSTSSKG